MESIFEVILYLGLTNFSICLYEVCDIFHVVESCHGFYFLFCSQCQVSRSVAVNNDPF